jgi:hypothetical protein
MTNSTYTRRRRIVSTVKKSQARIPAACWRRNARQLVAARPWEQPAQRREQRTVGGLSAGPWMLAAQHRKLVA